MEQIFDFYRIESDETSEHTIDIFHVSPAQLPMIIDKIEDNFCRYDQIDKETFRVFGSKSAIDLLYSELLELKSNLDLLERCLPD